ncbi:rRNA-binding ribosome biosynthesis protein utp25 [Rhizophlyctis rosea]|nr:rRNA-binding ribosome biosynthesis protein utp25 [Rhizophlyctis rosea]
MPPSKRKAQLEQTDDWERPASFNKLLKNLKKSSKRNTDGSTKKERVTVHKDKKPRLTDRESLEADELEEQEPTQSDAILTANDEVDEGDFNEDHDEAEADGWENELNDDGVDNDEDDDVEAGGDEDDEDEDGSGADADPFTSHFSDSVSTSLVFAAAQAAQNAWIARKDEDPVLKTVISYNLPNNDSSSTEAPSIHGEEPVALDELKIKSRLHDPFQKLNSPLTPTDTNTPFTSLQSHLLPYMTAYKDVLFTHQTHANSRELRHTYCLHAVNHVFKTRDRVLKNTAKIKAVGEEGKDGLEIRDQGFTRAKVLILVPFRNTALEVVKMLIALSGTKQQDNKKRFMDEFGINPEDDVMNPKAPEDHKKTFAGNIDDCFRVGIKFSRKQMKLFAPFYSSDVIVASPLGLRMVIGAEGDKKRDFDFLSSIEVMILDSTEVFLMQNWDHVQHIFDHLNLIPKDPHGCDFSRVRSYYLDGRAKNVRQTLLFSQFVTPQLNSLFTTQTHNTTGRIKLLYPSTTGTITQIAHTLPQLFHRVPVPQNSPSLAPDARFSFFTERIMPSIISKAGTVTQQGTLIFVSDYFDFVRVRNWIKAQVGGDRDMEKVGFLSEYTEGPDISRVRGAFFRKEIGLIVMTERFHFFRRYRLRGVKSVVFYDLPVFGGFYPEVVNMVDGGGKEGSVGDEG